MTAVKATAGESFDLTVATDPSVPGATVTLVGVYGIDGVDTGYDSDGESLVFPITMDEGAPGVYSTRIVLPTSGPFWARFSINGAPSVPVVVRVTDGVYPGDGSNLEPFTLAVTTQTSPPSLQLYLRYSDGSSAGSGVTWPQAMTVVPGYDDCWFYEDVSFSEGGRVQVVVSPPAGAAMNSVLTIYQHPQASSYSHFSGFEPDSAYVANDWLSLSFIRRWTGWGGNVSDETVRELRALAIDTFISETNCYALGWHGTWHGLRGQGTRLYLPMPVVLPSSGGGTLEVFYTDRTGYMDELEEIDVEDVAWMVGGQHARQPYIEWSHGSHWDHTLAVRIRATWGLGARASVPLRAKQALVGLIRWHSLSFGVDSDAARDQSTLNRITSESNRDVSHDYHETAVGFGLTGDRTVDRLLAEFRVNPGPWAVRDGDLPNSSSPP